MRLQLNQVNGKWTIFSIFLMLLTTQRALLHKSHSPIHTYMKMNELSTAEFKVDNLVRVGEAI